MTTVFIISAPSGSGKSTLVARLMAMVPSLRFSVSYTTRAPRGQERPGGHYHYVSREEFQAAIAREKGLQPLADMILAQSKDGSPVLAAADFISEEKGVADVEAALQGDDGDSGEAPKQQATRMTGRCGGGPARKIVKRDGGDVFQSVRQRAKPGE